MAMIYILIGILIFALACLVFGMLAYLGLMLYLDVTDELKSREMIKAKRKE